MYNMAKYLKILSPYKKYSLYYNPTIIKIFPWEYALMDNKLNIFTLHNISAAIKFRRHNLTMTARTAPPLRFHIKRPPRHDAQIPNPFG